MISDQSLQVPVLFIIFNRPATALKTLETIRAVTPKRLLIAADGPRHTDEEALCEQTRQCVLDNIDWECDVETLFADTNLGCGVRVYTAIDWVFSQYETAIILEDDCIANTSFFSFCEGMLEHYRDDTRIMHISGNNFQDSDLGIEHSYYFSKYPHAWGWATWRRAWQHFDWHASQWPEFKRGGGLNRWCNNRFEKQHWRAIFEQVHGGKNDIWDYQWVLACWATNGLAIVPQVNLVSNIGFGDDATHTKERNVFLERETGLLDEIKHPHKVSTNQMADSLTFDRNFGGAQLKRQASLAFRLKRLIRRLISRS